MSGTDKQQTTEDALRKSEARYRELVENASVWIWETDSNLRHVYTNLFVTACLGYQPDEFLAADISSLTHAEDHGIMKEVVCRATTERKGWSGVVLRWRHKDGSWRYIESSGTPVFDATGALIALRGVDQDITEKKKAEDALRESEERFRSIFDGTMDGIAMVDTASGNFVMANKTLCAMLRCTENELRAMRPDHIHPADVMPHVMKHLEETARGKVSVIREIPVKRRDGSIFYADISASAVILGGITHFVGIFRDVTEQKVALEEQQKLASIIEHSPDLIGIADLEGKLLYLNAAGQRLVGLESIEDVRHLPVRQFHLESDYRKFETEILPSLLQTGIWMGEIAYRHFTTGAPIPVEMHSFMIRDKKAGQPIALANISRNITERKLAEEALRASEARFRQLAETIKEVFWLGAPDWSRISYISPSYELVWGRQCEELYRNSMMWIESAVEEDRKAVIDTIPGPGFIWHGELRFPDYRIVRPDGTIRWISARAYPIRNAEGVVTSVAGIAEDITERKTAEEILRENQARLDLALQSACMGVWHMDIIENRRSFDEQVCHLLGLNPATFTGSAEEFFGTISPDDRESVRAALARTIEQDMLYEPEYRTVWPDGSVHYVTARGRLVRDEAGRPVRINGIIWDVTERKEAEQQIRDSEKKFSAIFSIIPDPTTLTDIETGKIIDVNEAAALWFGLPRTDLIGMTTAEVPVSADLSDRDQMLREMQSRGEINDMELRLCRHNSEVRDVLFSSRLIEIGGRRYLLSRAHDITEIKKAEAEKRELERQLMQAHRIESLGVLAGGIAHDFNNLLQGIFGYISMAKMKIDQRERALAMIEEAEKALHQTVSLTTQLLTFSKGGKPVMKSIRLMPVIENIVKFALSGSRVDYAIDIDAALWIVEGDEGQIGQVIQNLVINADQAMPMGGRIVIRARNVQAPKGQIPVDLSAGNYVEISVQDSGIGIPKQYLESIFDPYFTTKEKGSGLGLAISYSIIRNHGGMIHVASEVGRGSTFSLYLPATAESPADVVPRRREATGQTRKGRVLLMDDERLVRDIATEMIKALGHEVECVGHGEEAVKKFLQARQQGVPFDVVILDLTIRGGMGGVETLKNLIEIDPKVKAVVSSGYSKDSVVADYRSHGFFATLSKPYNITVLRDTLDALLAL
jgi:two-component system, cell cycle sensor histidine kinase and response regulator CckA